ncbi:vacuolar-sorting protein SNF8 isoform X2 [Ornithorhynchus anatinus]|uniref:vacuolar-sorting protein SNF8 isoform X2 n=1 Tax=Ornithorhynchus anatinus TaxID=9258 RepID=UPI0010A7838A|nr:vacuolar-sorting protein SNF8 isoform X2 [Ornithorhynchus anatinus]
MHRRGVGAGAIAKKKLAEAKYKERGTVLAEDQLAQPGLRGGAMKATGMPHAPCVPAEAFPFPRITARPPVPPSRRGTPPTPRPAPERAEDVEAAGHVQDQPGRVCQQAQAGDPEEPPVPGAVPRYVRHHWGGSLSLRERLLVRDAGRGRLLLRTRRPDHRSVPGPETPQWGPDHPGGVAAAGAEGAGQTGPGRQPGRPDPGHQEAEGPRHRVQHHPGRGHLPGPVGPGRAEHGSHGGAAAGRETRLRDGRRDQDLPQVGDAAGAAGADREPRVGRGLYPA